MISLLSGLFGPPRDPEKHYTQWPLRFTFENSGVVSIHVSEGLEDYSMTGRMEKLQEGFVKLARELRDNPIYKDVKRVVICSYVINKAPRFIKSHGFKIETEDNKLNQKLIKNYQTKKTELHRTGGPVVEERYRDLSPGIAYANREDFIRIHLENN